MLITGKSAKRGKFTPRMIVRFFCRLTGVAIASLRRGAIRLFGRILVIARDRRGEAYLEKSCQE